MNKLEELIERLCPNGVEWKELGEISTILIGEFVHKSKQSNDGVYPVYNGGVINTGFYDEFNRKKNKVIISARGANAGFVNRVFTNFWAGNSCYTISVDESLLNWNYLYYFLKKHENELMKIKQIGSIPAVSKKQVENFRIPIPPLKIQEEIVKVLDKMTNLVCALEEQLESELEKRKKQYEYYRDTLLIFGDDVARVKLKDISKFMFRGNGIKRDDLSTYGTPCIRYGEIYTNYNIYFKDCKSFINEERIKNKKYIEYGDILFAITGENVNEIGKSIAYIGKEKVLVGGDILVLRHNYNPKYLSYALSTTDAKKQKSKGKIKSKVVHTNAESIGNIEIPLPPLSEQGRIVSILDRFDKLCNDITKGIPAEIEARKKQYEYYRDKLLTFKDIKENK